MGQSSRRGQSLLYVLIGLLAAAAGLVVGFIDETFLGGGAIAPATVLKVEETSVKGGTFDPNDPTPSVTGFRIFYKYEDAAGATREDTQNVAATTLEKGDTIRIQYLPGAPKRAHGVSHIVADKPSWRWIAMGGMLLLAVVLVLVGVLGLFRRRPAVVTALPTPPPAPDASPAATPTTSPENNAAGITAATGQPPAAFTPERQNEG